MKSWIIWSKAFNRYSEFHASLEAIIRQLPEKRLQSEIYEKLRTIHSFVLTYARSTPQSRRSCYPKRLISLQSTKRSPNMSVTQSRLQSDPCYSVMIAHGRKKSANNQCDVTMGSFNGAETCQLVGCYILSLFTVKYGRNIGLYRDDGLAALITTRNREDQKRAV